MREAHPVNPLAPHLGHRLSPEAEAAVRELQASGRMSEFATPDSAVLRRDPEHDRASVLRPAFVRDSDKICHIPAYNRLAGKTQVFSFRSNDDLTRRGLHVQLVARIARDISRALGLNVKLTEAIALGHDIGHTPFGHAGERFLNDVYHSRTGRWFFHNVQSVRVLDVLYGRNLALQTLDGVLCHNGEFEQQVLEVGDVHDFAAFDQTVEECWANGDAKIRTLRPSTIEGCVVRVSDIIAYVGKDRQDAVSAHLLEPDAFADGLGGAYNSWALSTFGTDIVEHSLGKPRIEMIEEAFAEMRRAKRENYELIYGDAEVTGDLTDDVASIFHALYETILDDIAAGREGAPVFRHHIVRLDEFLSHYGRHYEWQSDPDLTAVDFISSMTDDYFMQLAEHLFPEAAELFPRRGYFM